MWQQRIWLSCRVAAGLKQSWKPPHPSNSKGLDASSAGPTGPRIASPGGSALSSWHPSYNKKLNLHRLIFAWHILGPGLYAADSNTRNCKQEKTWERIRASLTSCPSLPLSLNQKLLNTLWSAPAQSTGLSFSPEIDHLGRNITADFSIILIAICIEMKCTLF